MLRCQRIPESVTLSMEWRWARSSNLQIGFLILGVLRTMSSPDVHICTYMYIVHCRDNWWSIFFLAMLSNSKPKKNTGKFSNPWESTKREALYSPLTPCRCFSSEKKHIFSLGKGSKKKLGKSGQADAWVTPPPPQSGQPDRFFTVFFFNPSLIKIYIYDFCV